MDRWTVVAKLDFLPPEQEKSILRARSPMLEEDTIHGMVRLGILCRQAYRQGDLTTLFSLRTLLTWAQNIEMLSDCAEAFRFAFYNRCAEIEQPVLVELYQRCFDSELDQAPVDVGLF
jgi:cobaltochelatase CobS